MSDFLIKSTITLFVLLAVYYLFLEKEKIHVFNRFYLLFSLVFSMVIPFITIEVIQEIAQPTVNPGTIRILQGSAVIMEETNYLAIGLWSLYAVVTLVLAVRFFSNIIKISSKMKSNTPIDYKNAKLILVPEKTLPHTFLNTIFINETEYNNREIEAELYTHELTHVTQKHTLDILFIELLKTVFWFNPIFIFYKKAIQLNHEFLADEKVVTSYNNVPFYQSLLLSKANENQTFYLASNLNYLITKKRLIMMTKTTSKTEALLKKAMLIPVVTALLFLLCTKVVAQETNVKKETTPAKPGNLFKTYYDKTTFKIKDEKGKIASEKKYNELTPVEKRAIPSILSKQKELPTNEELLATLSKGAPEVIEIDTYDSKNQFVQKGENEVYNTAGITEKPDFPGGIMEFYKFVGNNFKTPEQPNLKGKVYITFIIEKDGSLSDIKNIRDIGFGTGEEAIRVLKICPKWIPGKMNGVPVRVMYSLPITIQSGKS
ncbi:Signal transducer regulating beta-lactamase production, contains metallopeptidase domain [Flavobacterium omnivorum]|uniref:Signal transducer regulating beta-lactamase production, contains metallopeptidase domain n=1 Tax=Flavobacterium omnivorum TaxID=178355 RepID=A0A1G7YFU4_9FLAO|nr:M56 family metallopeptidase [Flavobacterium omnivorum]SDG95129.1 Signal transducer regulating beta-lactamase production, contains metallopeptidase domain [Flavobacterium omnivorum]